MDIPISWCGQFSDASQRFFVLRHHSWMYPYRDAGQFSDASHRVFFTTSLFMDIPISWCGSIFWCKSTVFCITSPFMDVPMSWCGSIFWCKSPRFFHYVTVHGYTHIMMRVKFLMQVNGFLFLKLHAFVFLGRFDWHAFTMPAFHDECRESNWEEFVARFERIIRSAYVGKELRYSNFKSYVGDPHQKLLIQEGTSLWRGILKLYLKIKGKKDHKECICLWAVSHFLIVITGSKSAILLSSWQWVNDPSIKFKMLLEENYEV